MRPIPLLLTVSAAALLAACGSQPPAPEQNPAGVETRQPSGIGGGDDNGSVKPVAGDALDPYRLEALKDPKSPLSKRSIFFDYDQYVVKDEYRPLIEAHAQFLIHNPKMKLLIQGNADERGSREYNLSLGQKRAEAIKKSLILLGAREEQLESVSLGEEKPRCAEASESCWAQNRRGDLVYSGE